MTIDFMLTIKKPGALKFDYHGVSVKPSAQINNAAVRKRHEREALRLSEWGATHEIATELDVTDKQVLTCERIISYMQFTDDLGIYQRDAMQLAYYLKRTQAKGPMDRVIGIVSRKLGWNLDEGYRLFAIAVFFGYLRWNFYDELLPYRPPSLA